MNRGEEKVRVHMDVVPRSTMKRNGETEVKRFFFFFTSRGFLVPFTRPSGLFMASISTLIHSSGLIVCSTIKVPGDCLHCNKPEQTENKSTANLAQLRNF